MSNEGDSHFFPLLFTDDLKKEDINQDLHNLLGKNRYTLSSLTEKIKKTLTITKLNVEEYINNIEKHKKNRHPSHYYYDYDLELDFSIDIYNSNSNNKKIYDDRLYYYKAYHFQKLGLFKREDVPPFKVKLSHLPPDLIYELSLMDENDRRFVLKQAVSRIFEDINFDLYHDSISKNLKVVLVK